MTEKQKCIYPDCGKASNITMSLPLLYIGEDGIAKPQGSEESNVAIGFPVCMKHMMFLGSGHFGVLEKDGGHVLHGPFPDVALIETICQTLILEREVENTKK